MNTHAQMLETYQEMAARLLGDAAAGKIRFSWIEEDPSGDCFEISGSASGVTIKGNSGPALGMGLHTYLKEVAGLHVSWYGSRLKLPQLLPSPARPIFRRSWAKHRYFLNYCCFSYSVAFWDWTQWERLLDWMALNGVNRPLAITGQEAVWIRVGRRLGLSDQQLKEFLAGPAYLPFGWMGCLDGWGGPPSLRWCEEHEELGRRILARERAFGMTPVLQGFTGHVPRALGELHPDADLHTIRWHEWQTFVLDPLDARFPLIASIYAEEQARSFGSDHYYAADTFIEMTPPSGELDYLSRLGRAIFEGMRAADPLAVWVLQGWAFMDKREFWTQPRIEAFLNDVPDDRMLILDLHCECAPMWSQTKAFAGKPWLWCNVQNFGRNTHLTAALGANNEGLMDARRSPDRGRMEGLGMVNEGLCYNPVAYEFLFEQAWRDEAVDLAAWGRGFCARRYGAHQPEAEKAWDILIPAVYTRFQGERCEHLRRPSEAVPAVATPRDGSLEQAWRLLLAAAPALNDLDTYRFDLVNLGRQTLSNRATLLKRDLQAALFAGQSADFERIGGELIAVLQDMDELLATREEFLLGLWLSDARRWGATPEEQDALEVSARRQITIWGDTDILRDYARKEWAGLLSVFYVTRWRRYIAAGREALSMRQPFDPIAFERDLLNWEREWITCREPHAVKTSGDAVSISQRLIARYGQPYRETVGIVVGLDLGGTWIKGAVRGGGKLENVQRWKNPLDSVFTAESYADFIVSRCRELAEGRPIRAVIASTAGEVDAAGASYRIAGKHLGVMATQPWRPLAENVLGCSITLVNDAEAFVLGWSESGQLDLRRDIGFLVVGTGLGFSVVRAGRWWKPARRLNFLGSAWTPCGTYDDWISAVNAAEKAGGDLSKFLSSFEYGEQREAYIEALARVAASAAILYHLDEIVLGGGLVDAAKAAGLDLGQRLGQRLKELFPPAFVAPKLTLAKEGNQLILEGVLALADGQAHAEAARYRGDFRNLRTEEAISPALEKMTAPEIARHLAAAEAHAAQDFLVETDALARVAQTVAHALRQGGRVVYVGAGTSGRVGALDAVEIPCTYGLDPSRFVALVAGGLADSALTIEGEGEEDISSVPELLLLQLGPRDVVLGISASGSAFYVRSALAYARRRGSHAVLIHESEPVGASFYDDSIALHSGPECVSGSTRMKAGTATKKALNILSTTAMILLGNVRKGRMIDVVCSNDKLRRRAEEILKDVSGISLVEARKMLQQCGYNLRFCCDHFLADGR